MVYTGPQNGHEDVIRFSTHYGENEVDGADLPLQLNVKMLYNSAARTGGAG